MLMFYLEVDNVLGTEVVVEAFRVQEIQAGCILLEDDFVVNGSASKNEEQQWTFENASIINEKDQSLIGNSGTAFTDIARDNSKLQHPRRPPIIHEYTCLLYTSPSPRDS